jgi:hypothetical protein
MYGLAAWGGYLYFTNLDSTTSASWIGRASLDGLGVTYHYLAASGTGSTTWVAADAGTADPTATGVACSPSAVQLLDPQPYPYLLIPIVHGHRP